ncbi:MAG TPA: 1-deoxy-D-xylulose-5-phosphate synthase [Actinomycetota bacterium]|nr:1-deoxy-D-xylulose-5-phosphate synthase [Actinomycetota bacterium]
MTALLQAQPVVRRLLQGIAGPADLQNLSPSDIEDLAAEIRSFLIDNVCSTGGHLGANLGVVELTIALHRVFTSPHDLILFDTGHQAYVHKMLTGRLADFASLRQAGGMSGYPSRSESDHDVIENSHASTALSYADGLAKAFELRGVGNRRIVAVVGDGAMTGGMCWEALNNVGAAPQRPVIIVLNDNGRSYLPTVGGFARHLAQLRNYGSEAGHNLFRELGLEYLGPIDGHDTPAVEDALREAAGLLRPVVVHCVTAKGKGFPPAEEDDLDRFHAVGVVDPATGRPRRPGDRSWTSVFAEEITAIGEERDDVVCLTAAMLHPVGLGGFAARFPERVFDIGIAEQHAVTSAAGLAIGGLHPVVAIYASFIGRALDQLIMDVALHRLPVTIVTDRAGVTGPDGASHHGMWDASILPVIPGLKVASPRDPSQLRELLREAVDVTDGPTVIRYPKASVCPDVPAVRRYGSCDLLREDPGAEVLLVSVGPLAAECLRAASELAAQGVAVSVADPRWTTPLDPALFEVCERYELVLAVEDTTTTGALGARIAQALAAGSSRTRAATFALPTRFLPQAPRDELLRAHGLDASGIAATVLKRLAHPPDPVDRTSEAR